MHTLNFGLLTTLLERRGEGWGRLWDRVEGHVARSAPIKHLDLYCRRGGVGSRVHRGWGGAGWDESTSHATWLGHNTTHGTTEVGHSGTQRRRDQVGGLLGGAAVDGVGRCHACSIKTCVALLSTNVQA